MRAIGIFLLLTWFLVGCDQFHSSTATDESVNDIIDVELLNQSTANSPFMPGAIFERSWVNGHHWELVKPRPPGVGAGKNKAMDIYQIAPVIEDDPLSPPIEVPDVITLGGRDHVLDSQNVSRKNFRGIANTVLVQYPDWSFAPPFGPVECAIPDLGPIADRIAWRWLEVSVHPCGQIPLVYAVDFEDDGCLQPLTTVDRVNAAVSGGFAEFDLPPEEPWPFAIRPLTEQGEGKVSTHAPACV